VPESRQNRFQRFHLSLTVIVLIGLFAGCSKNSSSSQSAAPQSFNLGPVELTYDTPSRKDLGNGSSCVLTARSMDQQNCELLADLEKSGKKIASSRVMPAKIGAPLELSFGTVIVQLTPQIKP